MWVRPESTTQPGAKTLVTYQLSSLKYHLPVMTTNRRIAILNTLKAWWTIRGIRGFCYEVTYIHDVNTQLGGQPMEECYKTDDYKWSKLSIDRIWRCELTAKCDSTRHPTTGGMASCNQDAKFGLVGVLDNITWWHILVCKDLTHNQEQNQFWNSDEKMIPTMHPEAVKPSTIALTAKITVAKYFGFLKTASK